MKHPTIIIGYSGHAYVVLDILISNNYPIIGYCDSIEKELNPFQITYLGKETEAYPLSSLQINNYFVCIGDNSIRAKVLENLATKLKKPSINAIHSNAICASTVKWHPQGGILVAANATINPLVQIGKGVICNTSCTIEHECVIGDYVHIAPGAVLCGNVKVGNNTFIGANAVVKQGITIGKNVVIGAGSVVLHHLQDNVVVAGNPARVIR
jgi:sugar O-acyltransferase (sialic acid O-acetyltransferase NeuD family)